MDLSALIFVALAVAWAVYLVPKALRQHEEDSVSRSVDGFSDRLRVLARREAVSATEAELVPAGRAAARKEERVRSVEANTDSDTATEEPAAPTPAPRATRTPVTATPAVRRGAARRAAARRRRVFNVLLVAIVVVVALGIGKVIGLAWTVIPVALMALWLVACRLMVKRERAARSSATRVRKRRRTLADEVIEAESELRVEDEFPELGDNTEEIPVVTAEVITEEPVVDGWTPVPVPLPTYVEKAPATRTVRTIDLDSTGVWSSGRNDADSELAREADAHRAADADAEGEQRRALGS